MLQWLKTQPQSYTPWRGWRWCLLLLSLFSLSKYIKKTVVKPNETWLDEDDDDEFPSRKKNRKALHNCNDEKTTFISFVSHFYIHSLLVDVCSSPPRNKIQKNNSLLLFSHFLSSSVYLIFCTVCAIIKIIFFLQYENEHWDIGGAHGSDFLRKVFFLLIFAWSAEFDSF